MTLAVPDTDVQEIAQIRLSDEDWGELLSLTELQRAFVFEYVKDLNGTRAAKRAGYQGPDSTLAVRGSTLVRHPKINPLIRKLTKATADEMGITKEYLIARLEEVAADAALAGNHAAANSTLRTLAQLRGDMVEQVQHDHRVVQVVINDVDVKELR
jgi:phage terminase small subunit